MAVGLLMRLLKLLTVDRKLQGNGFSGSQVLVSSACHVRGSEIRRLLIFDSNVVQGLPSFPAALTILKFDPGYRLKQP